MKIFITGITGTLGSNLCNLLLNENHHVIGFSRDELKQQQFPTHPNLTLYLGDVRDKDRVVEATRDVDLIFHLAALKHVDKLEQNPDEALKTNILGTNNVLHAQRVNHVERVVLASTDKACTPINSYGASKFLAERLVLRNSCNVVARYGNVLGSRGSVLSKFVETIIKEQAVYITDKKMTRFWITQEDAALFVWLASQKPEGGLYVPKMQAAPVIKVAQAVSKILGREIKKVNYVGLRPGEKIHEQLRTEDEGGAVFSSEQDLWFSEKELFNVLKPIIEEISR